MSFFSDDDAATDPSDPEEDYLGGLRSFAEGTISAGLDVLKESTVQKLEAVANEVGISAEAAQGAISAERQMLPQAGIAYDVAKASFHYGETLGSVIAGDGNGVIDHGLSFAEDVAGVVTGGWSDIAVGGADMAMSPLGLSKENATVHERAVAQVHRAIDTSSDAVHSVAEGDYLDAVKDAGHLGFMLTGGELTGRVMVEVAEKYVGHDLAEDGAEPAHERAMPEFHHTPVMDADPDPTYIELDDEAGLP